MRNLVNQVRKGVQGLRDRKEKQKDYSQWMEIYLSETRSEWREKWGLAVNNLVKSNPVLKNSLSD